MPTRIEWADESWNPVTGCSPVSIGCEHCYAARMARRLAGRYGYHKADPFTITLRPERLAQPFGWWRPRRMFVVSMGDLFHPDVSEHFRRAVFGVMSYAGEHTYLVLTKRAEAMRTWFAGTSLASCQSAFLRGSWSAAQEAAARHGEQLVRMTHSATSKAIAARHHRAVDGIGNKQWPLPNVWLGVTIEHQSVALMRPQHLAWTPAAVRFICCEPLLGPIDSPNLGLGMPWGVDWVIVGGETGPGARLMRLEWARALRDQCKADGTPFFLKQIGAKRPTPPDLRIRQFPKEITRD